MDDRRHSRTDEPERDWDASATRVGPGREDRVRWWVTPKGLRVEATEGVTLTLSKLGAKIHIPAAEVCALAGIIDQLREHETFEGLSNTGPLYTRIREVAQNPDYTEGEALRIILSMVCDASAPAGEG